MEVLKLAGIFEKKKKQEKSKEEVKLPLPQRIVSDFRDLIYVLAIFMFIYMLLLRVVVVVGPSMYNTLVDGDRLVLISRVLYQNPKQGDVIVASMDSFDNCATIVKRVIVVEGQKVDIDFDAGIVYVDDKPLDEPYTYTPTNVREGVTFPLIVEEGCVFVLGDNRNGSKDSRSPDLGCVDKREVLGKVIFLFFPGTNGTDYRGVPMEERDFTRIGVVS